MIRVIPLCAGLCGALALSQYPAFSHAYLQRLAGQVDALTLVVKDFDASALAAGLGRQEALEQMTGTDFLAARQGDMRRTFARHASLTLALAELRGATPLERIAQPHLMADPDIAAAAWGDFEPGMPLGLAGAVTAGVGMVLGWFVGAGLASLIRTPFRRARRSRPIASHQARPSDPPVARPGPTLVASGPARPRLMGERRGG